MLVGAIAGNLRSVALSTTVTLLVPEDGRDRANGLVGTANGVSFSMTSVFSGLAIGQLGMGACLLIAVVLTALAAAHLLTIRIEEEAPKPSADAPRVIDLGGAISAVRLVPGLLALLLFSTFNNFLGGVFMSLMDPYGLTLMSVEAWGILIAITSLGFIVGGIVVARRGLGRNPVRTLLLANVVMWIVTIVFPLRPEILPLAIGFFVYLVLAPVAEASEQTIIQQVVPFQEQGRVFGFAQSLETAAAPITAFLIGPIAQFWVIPSMTDGALADSIGSWFGTGPDRGMALIFIVAGIIGLAVTLRRCARRRTGGCRTSTPPPRANPSARSPSRHRRPEHTNIAQPALPDGGTMTTATRTDPQASALHAADSHDLIRVQGARVNNLKDVDVEIPKRRLTRVHRRLRVGQELAGLRHDRRRVAADDQRDVQRLRAGLHAHDGPARRRRPGRADDGDHRRPGTDGRQHPLDGRHRHRRQRDAAHPVQPARTAAHRLTAGVLLQHPVGHRQRGDHRGARATTSRRRRAGRSRSSAGCVPDARARAP